MKILAIPFLLAGLAWAQPKTETGELNGAAFKIEVPEKWNGGLVMYVHGYSAVPIRYDNPKPNPVLGAFLEEGYAVAQSGYKAGGWAIQVDTLLPGTPLREGARLHLRSHSAGAEPAAPTHAAGAGLAPTQAEIGQADCR